MSQKQTAKSNQFGVDAEGRMSTRLTLPMPPSDNTIYFNLPHGGRALSSGAKKYKRDVKALVSRLIAKADTDGADFITCVPYSFILTIYFKATENKTWNPEKKRSAGTRYKKQDAGNRQKLVIDAVMSAIGIDDRQIFREVIRKRCDPEDPRVVIIVREQEPRYA